MILTKIELGEIDPDDPQSGIQYGDVGDWDMSSVKSGEEEEGGSLRRRRGRRRKKNKTGWGSGSNKGWFAGMREWEDVFRVSGSGGAGAGAGGSRSRSAAGVCC